jgi:hypothetical protein
MMAHSPWLTLIVPAGSAALAGPAAAGGATQLAKIAGRGALARAYDRRDRAHAALRPWQRGLLAALQLTEGTYPSAPVSALAGGAEGPRAFWMHLEPVHLVTSLDSLSLLPLSGAAQVTAEERERLREGVADHLREWNLELRVLTDGTWNVRGLQALEIVTFCPEAAATSALENALPQGKDAGALRRLMTELQMLLHTHPVNEVRARTGLPAINALWPWGSGVGTDIGADTLPLAFGEAAYLRGLYLHQPQSIHPAPADSRQLLQSSAAMTRVIAVVAAEDQAALEENWVAPLARALAAGQLSRLDLVLDDWHVDVSRAALRKFWRRPLPPSQWAA